MDNNKFYRIDSKLSSSTVQVHAVGVDKITFSDDLAAEWHLVMGDYSGISFPVVFKQEYGKKLQDILDTGWPSLHLISNKMKTVLEDNNLTGWKTFSVKVLDMQGQEIYGYHGFSVTGRCNKIDYGKSEIVEKRLVPNGPLIKFYQGLHIEVDKWDGKDFFLPEKYFGIMITQKVAEIVKKSKLTNVLLENLTIIETDYSTVQAALQNQDIL
ncbi:MAG: imm11 family protein [Minisyncoccia bacterium]